MRCIPRWVPWFALALAAFHFRVGAEEPPREQVLKALRSATEYFRGSVATHGGYLWRYSEDLSNREGEGKASASMVWVQPPGTPAVGMAFLSAFEATGDRYYLEAATDTARALVKGQLRSGGWDYHIDFDPKKRRLAYRVNGKENGKNVTTLDDDTTQAALRLLMRVDKALEFQDAPIHEAAEYALASLLKAQYPNGAWAQRYDSFPEPEKFPVKPAAYPESWPRTFPNLDYRGFYTFNDNTLADTIETMLEAHRIYGATEPVVGPASVPAVGPGAKGEYLAAAKKAGGFILVAQMPEPQPAWAQQYDEQMQPAWARKFEPPAISGGESQGVLRILLALYRETGDEQFLKPVPRALEFLRGVRLPNGQLARFYELQTSRPLYFTKAYELTYSDNKMPTHYSFKVSDGLEKIAAEYERLRALTPEQLRDERRAAPPRAPDAGHVRKVLAALDEKGRWVTEGKLKSVSSKDVRIIDCRVFIHNLEALCAYLHSIGRRPTQ